MSNKKYGDWEPMKLPLGGFKRGELVCFMAGRSTDFPKTRLSQAVKSDVYITLEDESINLECRKSIYGEATNESSVDKTSDRGSIKR